MDVHRWGPFYKNKRRRTTIKNLYWCVSGQGWKDAGGKKGLKARVLQVAPHVNVKLCITHRESLASKTLEPELKHILDIAIKMINYIKHVHSISNFLLRGNVLSRLNELRDEVRIFLIEHWSQLADHLTDPDRLTRLAYLCEKTFSALTNIKNKYRAQLNVANNLRVAVSKIKQRIASLWHRYFGGRGLKSLGSPELVNHQHFRLVSSTKI